MPTSTNGYGDIGAVVGLDSFKVSFLLPKTKSYSARGEMLTICEIVEDLVDFG